ncbi:NADPH:quinone reductase, partial [Streptomyces sp. NPDC058206]
NRWFATASPADAQLALSEVRSLVTDEVLSIPQGQPFPLEHFTEAIAFAEAPAHGAKPLFVFEDGRDEDDR